MLTDASSAPLILTSGASGRVNALFSWRVLKSLALLVAAVLMLITVPFRGRKRPIAERSSGKDDGCKQECGGGSGSSSSSCSNRKMVRVPAKVVQWRNVAAAAVEMDHEVAARRAIAIRRVLQEKDNYDATSVREFSLFGTARGDTLFTQSWSPVGIKIRGIVVLLHGLNEHSGRYNDFAKKLNANGYKVYGMDWIGHGGSDGLHAYVHCLDYPVADMKQFLDKVSAENPGLPCFCFGHSTGGAIILKAVLDPKVEACIAGVIVTSPAVGVQPSHPIIAVIAPVFSFFLPRYQLSAANKNGIQVSRNPKALEEKYSDPLVYTGSIRVRTGWEILRISSHLQENRTRITVPFLVLHGTEDAVTDPQASKKLYEDASSIDKTIKLLDGCLHDLLLEPERDVIVNDIIEWLNCRVQS